jgi:hypothetical protein
MDDANNALRVNVVAGSAGGPSKVDDSAFSVGVDSVVPMGALVDDTATDPIDEGDVGIPRMSTRRVLLTEGQTPAGSVPVANPHLVGGSDGSTVRTLRMDVAGRPILGRRDDYVAVIYRKTGVLSGSAAGSSAYFLFIDLDNAGGAGPYKHGSGSSLLVGQIDATARKDQIGAQFISFIAVIKAINGTQATLVLIRPGNVGLRDTSTSQRDAKLDAFPFPLDLTVSGGSMSRIATGGDGEVTTTAVNTGITLPDVGGTGRTPAVGDVLLKVDKVAGLSTASLLFNYYVSYLVE